MRIHHCSACGNQVYFENTACGSCGAQLGFMPDRCEIGSFLQTDANPCWELLGRTDPATWRPCANRLSYAVCNWMLRADDKDSLCTSCRLTSTVPSLDDAGNGRRWALIEAAKRRLVYTLLDLGVPFHAKRAADDVQGLEFRWLASTDQQPALTGHQDGVVTLNIVEADDDRRESTRVQFGEPSRTVLGHLRHEVSHHLHQRWVEGSAQEPAFRQLFGDERADYAAALQTHYANGPAADWSDRFISAYASAHPWEDWAETCAHYLLMVDAVETAAAWGLRLHEGLGAEPVGERSTADVRVDDLVFRHWLPVARFLNAMSRSLGLRDSYPFLIADPVLEKLRFVQQVLAGAGKPAPAS